MLTSLHLQNFQIHTDLYLVLDQITVFVGDNDSGKSSILRALLFTMLNEWGGMANTHVTFDEYESYLELGIDGFLVCRSKGDNTNSYSLNEEQFHAFGMNKVPSPIAQLLNVSIDNFQQQDDPPFWLSLTSGQAASALNDIFCLTAIDDSLENVARELRQAKAKKKIVEERLEAARVNSKSLLWTKQADRDLKGLEELHERLGTVREKCNTLSRHIAQIQSHDRDRQIWEGQLEVVEERLRTGRRVIEIQARINLIQEVLSMESKIEQWSKTLLSKQIKLAEFIKGKCPLCKRG